MKQLTRDQAAVWNVNTSFTHFRPVVEDVGIAEVTKSFDLFESAVCNFVLSELSFRQAERCKLLAVFPELASHANTQGAAKNSSGISNLQQAVSLLKNIPDGGDKAPISDGRLKFDPAEPLRLLKEQISLLEIKGSDAEELGKLVEKVLITDVINLNSPASLVSSLTGRLNELAEIRARKDRGAETNIPVWKLVAAAAILLVALWIVYKCYYSKWSCSKREKAIYNSVLSVAMIVFGACE